MAASLFRKRRVLAPRGFAIWIAFLLWMFGSIIEVGTVDKIIRFAYTASLYVAITILLLYVFNISREALPTERVIAILAIFWMFVVIWGVLGVIAPTFNFTSPVEKIMPHRFAENSFIHDLVHPALAQVQDILGYEQPRPKAPFTYATNWGAAYAVLTPFVILGWKYSRSRGWKLLTAAVFALSIVPVVSSLDRGLWLSLGSGLIYAAIRLAIAGETRPLRTVIALIFAVLAIVYLTPLRTLVSDRFAHPHSNQGRLNLYSEATDRIQDSPLLGFGSPIPSIVNPNAPPVGTQGQFWQVLISHGIPGVMLFLGWFIYQFWRLRSAPTEVGFWCHVLILIALIQMPFYDSLGVPLAIQMIAIGIAWRESSPVRSPAHARTF
jgi:polysaccharide biosynthesis protein PslJ